MFIAGMTSIEEPPVNDIWTIPGEETMLDKWNKEDVEFFNRIDPTTYYMRCQIEDFVDAQDNNRDPSITGEAGRRTVELFTAIYISTRDNKPVRI
jgi:UDP-N-acetyl-2-amino-2-deoxyglucuronate dehydrogenase